MAISLPRSKHVVFTLIATVAHTHAFAQSPAAPSPSTVCGERIPPPAKQPPPESDPVIYQIVPCFEHQGGVSAVEAETYLYYIRTRPSIPSQDIWVPYDDAAYRRLLDDFKRLWGTGFLDDLAIHVEDYTFDNGVAGKLIVFQMEERPRVRNVTYTGSKALDTQAIQDGLSERKVEIHLDTFVDDGVLRRAEGVIRDLLREKGFPEARVTHAQTALPASPKLMHVAFTIDDGPKVKLRRVEFVGNRAVSARALRRQLKENRAASLLSLVTRRGTWRELKFEDDAERIAQYYRDRGYVHVRIGEPELKLLEASPDRSTRWVALRIPVSEGLRYRVGTFRLEGNSVASTDTLTPLFVVKPGTYYSESAIRKGLDKAREVYGAAGYSEFTGYPDLAARDADRIVDVTVRLQEGKQYFINRLTFVGNTTTRDSVIRREMAITEGAPFNTEALKYSIRRINQLGYFKPLEDQKNIQIDKTAGSDDRLDVTVRLEEQNRNQFSFGAGVSQYEGTFGTLSYTTTNFLGGGESVTLSLQKGSLSNIYQLSVSEPFVLNRPLSVGLDLYSRKNDFLTSASEVGYSEVRMGSGGTIGRPVGRFSRGFLNYTYEVIEIAVSEDLRNGGGSIAAGLPLLSTAFDEGRHIDSRVTPSLVFNTVNSPFTPRTGVKLTASAATAARSIGASNSYFRPEGEAVWYIPHLRRTALGLRASAGWLRPYGETTDLPYYLRFFLGGENQIRGVNIRTVGPLDAQDRALGGNKYVLFNAEYYFDIAGPVRALVYHDAGQAYPDGTRIDLRQLRTSSGAEVRVIVPMLNVPFRLIYYWNIYRDTFQPLRGFRFSVGTTF